MAMKDMKVLEMVKEFEIQIEARGGAKRYPVKVYRGFEGDFCARIMAAEPGEIAAGSEFFGRTMSEVLRCAHESLGNLECRR